MRPMPPIFINTDTSGNMSSSIKTHLKSAKNGLAIFGIVNKYDLSKTNKKSKNELKNPWCIC